MQLTDLSNEVKYIGFLFENLESIDVPIGKFHGLTIGQIKDFAIEDDTYFMTDYLSAEINYNEFSELRYIEAEEEYLLGMFAGNPVSNCVDDRPHILGALIQRDDLVAVEFLDHEKEIIKSIYTPDTEDEAYKNTSVRSVVEEGFVRVTVSGEFA